jgi:hypothetical protein
VGPPGGFVAGQLMDMKAAVALPDGSFVDDLCPLKSAAALACSHVPRTSAGHPECEPAFVLLTQCLRQLVHIPAALLKANRGSRLTELKLGMFEQGLPDSWPILVNPLAMANYHHLGLCQDPEHPGSFIYRLNVVNSALKGEVWLQAATAQTLRAWIWDSDRNSQVWACPVMTVAKLQLDEDRHSMPMLTKLTSFEDVITRLALLQEQGVVRVVVSSRGSYEHLATEPGSAGFRATDKQVDMAHEQVLALLRRCEGALGAVKTPWPTPLIETVTAVADPLEEQEAEWQAEVIKEVQRMKPEPNASGQERQERAERESAEDPNSVQAEREGTERAQRTHSDMMKKRHADPARVVPRFERN